MTNAETIAWNLGREVAQNPDKELQGPEEPPNPEQIQMDGDRMQSMMDLGPELFFHWVDRGWNAAMAERNGQ